MPHRGTLKKVWDNEKNWALLIETDERGDIKFNLWDKKYAGVTTNDNEQPFCDVHDFVGKRVVFDAKKGKPKANDPDDCWPSTIEMIALEEPLPEKSVRELALEIEREAAPIGSPNESAQEHAADKCDRLRALTMDVMNALGKWTAEIERLFKEP